MPDAVPRILFPTVEEVVETNRRVLQKIRVHKADRHRVLMGEVGKEKIRKTLEDAQSTRGDIYDKAAVILVGIVRGHPFESGNRRTAYTVAVDFLESNGFPVANTYDVSLIKGIRNGTHKKVDIASWLKGHGKQGSKRHD